VAPRSSLGALTFAAQFLDELWPVLLLLGVERVRIVPGLMAANPLDFVHYTISHSLAMAVLWAVVIGGVYGAIRKYGRGGWVHGEAGRLVDRPAEDVRAEDERCDAEAGAAERALLSCHECDGGGGECDSTSHANGGPSGAPLPVGG
jgi:hypothetical protein